jgi:hypothetical protein
VPDVTEILGKNWLIESKLSIKSGNILRCGVTLQDRGGRAARRKMREYEDQANNGIDHEK